MYKEKLQAQLELLEEVQQKSKDCCEAVGVIEGIIELGRQILSLTKEIDRIDKEEREKVKKNKIKLIAEIDAKKVFEEVMQSIN